MTRTISKRLFDILFSFFVVTFVLWWLIILIFFINYLIYDESTFFFQERIGKNKIPFTIYKFKSMKGEPPESSPLLSAEEKIRITSFGNFIRKYRIDEFPQFINVLKGEMSIVGPRPERLYYLEKMINSNRNVKQLLLIKPGITSFGQIRYGYAQNVLQMLERTRYDLIYLKNNTFSADMYTVLKTIVVITKGKGV